MFLTPSAKQLLRDNAPLLATIALLLVVLQVSSAYPDTWAYGMVIACLPALVFCRDAVRACFQAAQRIWGQGQPFAPSTQALLAVVVVAGLPLIALMRLVRFVRRFAHAQFGIGQAPATPAPTAFVSVKNRERNDHGGQEFPARTEARDPS